MKWPSSLLLSLLFILPLHTTHAHQQITGEIEGVSYEIALPEKWNGNLLLLAHGYIASEKPLSASFDSTEATLAQLLEDGWMIAATAYRRNGLIIREAIEDLNNLRDHIEKNYGNPFLVILEGRSMGGLIVTLIAENEPDRFQGALAIGAALQLQDPLYPVAKTHQPKTPLLFLSNQSEMEGPASYIQKTNKAPVIPVLWKISRDGHVNINETERLLALTALIEWITTSTIKESEDITYTPLNSDRDVRFEDALCIGKVIDISPNYGNIFINLSMEDFTQMGIHQGMTFFLTIGSHTAKIVYGTTYSDVTKGEWVAFPTADNVTRVAINFGNASEALKTQIDDVVFISLSEQSTSPAK
ncbi:MAG: SAM-dependent chlorinase/fluorinase [Opitutaceae bacterium]|nr:SAM-dependent chlorinase/fluorinase [Opitutaceae bacterium]